MLYGMILWGVLFLGMVWLLSAGIRAGFGGIRLSAIDAERPRGLKHSAFNRVHLIQRGLHHDQRAACLGSPAI